MPSGVVDGALIIDTGLDNKGFIRDAAQFRRAVETLTQAVQRSGQQMGASMSGYLKTLQQASGAAKGAASGQSALEKEIAKTEAAIARLNERQELARRKFEAAQEDAIAKATEKVGPYKGGEDYDLPFGHPETVEEWQERVSAAVNKAVEDFGAFEESATFRNLSTEAEYLNEKLEAMRTELANMREDGKGNGEDNIPAYIKAWEKMPTLSGMVMNSFQRISDAAGTVGLAFKYPIQAADRLGAALAKFAGNAALSFLKKLAAGAKNAAIQLAKLAGRAIMNGLKKIGQFAAGAAKSLLHLGRGARQSGRGFQFSLKNMLKYGLGIRGLFALFNKLRRAIKEGFDELAKSDTRVKAALGSLKASLGGLKGSLSAAFAPILTAVAPALTTLIDLLTRAVNAVGMFFAAITGQGYYTAAKGIQAIDGAASSASGSAKELKRQLAGFDELNILSAPGGGGGGSGGSGSGVNYTFEKTPIAASIQNFADQLKALVAAENWDGLGALFADKINGAFEKANRLISWDNLGGKITQIIDAVAGSFNSLVSKIKWEKIGETFATGANTIIKTGSEILTKFDFPALAASLTRGLNNFIIHVEWRDLGRLIAKYAGTVVKSLLAALTTIEWADAGKAFADAVNGLFDDESLFAAAGDTITAAFKGFFEWSASFLENFDAIKAADDIKTMLGRIKWGDIASGFWNAAKLAFQRAGDFLKVILGGDLYDVQGDAVEQMWERGSGNASSQSYARSLVAVVGDTIKQAVELLNNWLKDVDWVKMGQDFVDGIYDIDWTGIRDALFEHLQWLIDSISNFVAGAILQDLTKEDSVLARIIDFFAPGSSEKIRQLAPGLSQFIRNLPDKPERPNREENPEMKQLTDALEDNTEAVTGNTKVQSERGAGSVLGGLGRLLAGNNAGGSDKPQNVIVDGLPPIDLSDDAKMARAIEMLGQGKWYHEIDQALNLSKDQEKQLRAIEKLRTSIIDNAAYAANNALNSVGGKINDDRLRRFTEAIGDAKTNASVEVNFVPQGVSPAYLNKPLAALQSMFSPGADVTGRVNLTRNNFSTVQGFVQGYQGGAVSKPIDLTRPSWWSTVQGFVQSYQGGAVNKPIDLTRSSAWSSVQGFVGGFMGGGVYKPIDLTRSWWSTVQGFVQSYKGDNVAQGVYLAKDGWDWVDTWAKRYAQTAIEQRVVLKITDVTVSSGVAGARIAIGKAMGGIITAGGRSLSFASGGYLSGSGRGNWWRSARKYASGTSRAHGTMFVAGEAGPEIVGHINGRTEILNKSQLAQTMYSAVTSGMIAALRGITFTLPAMATGGIMPYEVSAQIAKSTAEINSTLNANNEDLIQTIISVAGQIVAALNRQNSQQPAGAGVLTAQQVINEINRQTLMFGASPLKGV